MVGTYGLNLTGPPNSSSGPTDGGWFEESDVLANALANGQIQNQSIPVNVPLANIQSTQEWLVQQVGANGQLGSTGYFVIGDNCVNGVATVLSKLGAPANVVVYMKPSNLAVYNYARYLYTKYIIPTPVGGVIRPIEYPIQAVFNTGGQVGALIGQVIGQGLVLVGASPPPAGSSEPTATAAQITVTLSQSSHTATITYANPNDPYLYDQNGNLIGNGADAGLSNDIISALITDLQNLTVSFPDFYSLPFVY